MSNHASCWCGNNRHDQIILLCGFKLFRTSQSSHGHASNVFPDSVFNIIYDWYWNDLEFSFSAAVKVRFTKHQLVVCDLQGNPATATSTGSGVTVWSFYSDSAAQGWVWWIYCWLFSTQFWIKQLHWSYTWFVCREKERTLRLSGLQFNRFIRFLQFNNNPLVYNNVLGCNITVSFPSKVFGIGGIWDDKGNTMHHEAMTS